VRDFALAEDVLQDAVVAALQHWPENGIPGHPRAWLLTTARRKAIDRLRRDTTFKTKRAELEVLAELERHSQEDEVDDTIPDERLRLIFTCCHPALSKQARVALTLRSVAGLTTTEVARAFLVPEITMAQRVVRAKRKIKAANIPYRVPPPNLWAERLGSVLAVVYLIFNEGHTATSGPALIRADLCREAIHLCRTLVDLAPEEPEVIGLLALMVLHDSRRTARTGNEGNFVTLEYQDRALWEQSRIEEGDKLLRAALAMGAPGPYQIQAAISAVHARADSFAETDWREISSLYAELYERQPSPVVKLNGSVALSFDQGPEAGLELLEQLEDGGELASYQPFFAAKADLLRRAGRTKEAEGAYETAIALTRNAAEKRFLEDRLQELTK